jgi:hypothetical protein
MKELALNILDTLIKGAENVDDKLHSALARLKEIRVNVENFSGDNSDPVAAEIQQLVFAS